MDMSTTQWVLILFGYMHVGVGVFWLYVWLHPPTTQLVRDSSMTKLAVILTLYSLIYPLDVIRDAIMYARTGVIK